MDKNFFICIMYFSLYLLLWFAFYKLYATVIDSFSVNHNASSNGAVGDIRKFMCTIGECQNR